MIGGLRGTIDEIMMDSIIVDVRGVGYLVYMPVKELDHLGARGEQVRVHIHTHVREDGIELYGFTRRQDLSVFEVLLSVSGVGPRLALSVLNTLQAEDFVNAVGSGDLTVLTQVSGVGRKTAERLVLELQDKVGRVEFGPDDVAQTMRDSTAREAVDALEALGYGRAEAMRVIRRVLQDIGSDEVDVQQLIRSGLSLLSGEGGVS